MQYALPVFTFNLAVTLKASDCVSLDEGDSLVFIVLLIEGGHFLIEHLGHQPVLREHHCDCTAAMRRFNPLSDVEVLRQHTSRECIHDQQKRQLTALMYPMHLACQQPDCTADTVDGMMV